ncbi:MAG: hypothetical protein PF693_10965 [Spirochaetia bacterium]|jgi:hypothetical protein|nr:hypothetical protein [Spirochaetia bacterium]
MSLLRLTQLAKQSTDPFSQAHLTIDYVHHEIHEGDFFEYVNAQDLTNGQVLSFLVVTPDTTKWPHFGFLIGAEAEFDLKMYEDATPDSDGDLVTAPAVENSNRNSANVNTTLIYGVPVLGAGSRGTLLRQWHGASGKNTGGKAGTSSEIILKQNTKYWFDITNSTVSDNFINWVVSFYEHTNK